jgi:hypothetical protein
MLRDNYDKQADLEDEASEQSRLCDLLERLEVDQFDQVFESLTPDEKSSFKAFVRASNPV